jgi:hypothetical protein
MDNGKQTVGTRITDVDMKMWNREEMVFKYLPIELVFHTN